MKEMTRSFYVNLFTTEPQADVNHVLDAIPSCVDEATNEHYANLILMKRLKKVSFKWDQQKPLA
jgi:hypothetical protein